MSTSLAPAKPVERGSSRSGRPCKLLHVITSMDVAQGGPPAGIRQISKELIEQGHSIEVACLDRPGGSPTIDSDLMIHSLGPGVGKYHYSRSFGPWLRAHAGRFDYVIAHGIWEYPCLATWRALRHSGTPYFVFTHGMLDPWFRRTYRLKHLKKALYWRASGHKILRDARAVFFTSEQERLLAGQSFRPYRCQGRTVGFGTTGATGSAVELRRAFHAAFPELMGKKLLLYLGRVTPKKGLDILIEAFARTIAKNIGCQLVIAGPDSPALKAAMERQASTSGVARHITWTGLLTDEQKWGAFYAADLFCLPSHQENFALGVTEALACGLPVLISNKVNIWREIDSARAGFVGNDDVSGTTVSLERWLALSAHEQDEMRKCARNCYEHAFTIKAAAQALVRALRDNEVSCQSTS